MESKWMKEKDELERLINVEKVSYEEIGRRYGCTGANIKKAAKQIGINLPIRNSNAGKEPANKGAGKKRYCLNCGNEITNRNASKYCCNQCQIDYEYKQYIERWKQGLENGIIGKNALSRHIKRYIFEKYHSSCQKCGWNKVNEFTGLVPLQIHHIDGNCFNNNEENLQLLCPNCHSLTENYGSRNKNATREKY